MPSNVRERMIAGAADLLSQHGLQATSFAEVTQATKTPRGSIYHHFPGGKNELVLAAIDRNAENWSKGVAAATRADTVAFVTELVGMVRSYLAGREFHSGSAVGAVIIGAENTEQLDHCRQAFEAFIEGVESGLIDTGVPRTAAHDFAAAFIPAVAGAMLVARGTRRFDEYDAISSMLIEQAAHLPHA